MITLDGLMELYKKRERGEELPETYLEDIDHYIKLKERGVKLGVTNKKQLEAAKVIAYILGWK